MARYTGPSTKIARKFGEPIFGADKDFDLIIEKDGEKAYIEVERGTHTDEDFFNAMDKIYQVMQNLEVEPAQFHFVSPNEQTLFGKTKRQFFLWIKQRLGGIDEVKGKIVADVANAISINTGTGSAEGDVTQAEVPIEDIETYSIPEKMTIASNS